MFVDWVWIGGLFDVLLLLWYYGVLVFVCCFEKFDGDVVFVLMVWYGVIYVFLLFIVLKLMCVVMVLCECYVLLLKLVVSGGELLGIELMVWGCDVFGVMINEFYG